MPSVSSINKIVLLLLLAAFSACNKQEKKSAAAGAPHQLLPEEAINIESYMSEPSGAKDSLKAKVKGKLTAPYMLRYQRADSPYAEFPRTLHVDFYNDSMKIESQLDALYGKYLQNQDKVFLRDSVIVKNLEKGDTVHCKTLWWDQKTERFTTDDSVRIYTRDKILFGTGMEADQNFRWYTIRHLTGTILTAGNAIPK
jgi:LPS export ABC transporter protein LptC